MKMQSLAAVLSVAFGGAVLSAHADDFVIQDGVLVEYTGAGGAVEIPNTVTVIGEEAFAWCMDLTSVTIGSGVTSIGDGAFRYCYGLTSVTIPNGVKRIGYGAFSWCNLTSVKIPDSVTNIGGGAFYGCNKLTSVTIPDSVASIGDSAFWGCSGLADNDGFVIVRNVLYYYCGAGGVVTIPGSVTGISDRAIGGYDNITSVTIPDSVASIGWDVFRNCAGLTSVIIGSGVTSIGGETFKNCGSLGSVRFLGNAPTLDEDVFYGVPETCVVTVPRGSTGWGVAIPGTWNGLKIQYAPSSPGAVAVAESVHVATTEAAPVDKAAAEYNGFLKDAAGKIAGSVQLKLAKAGKDGTSKVTGTVQLGSKKEKVSGTYKGGVLTAAGFSNVTLDKNGITGTYKTYTIDGTRNVFSAKDASSKSQAAAAMRTYKGAYTVAWQQGGPWGSVTVTVGNKGKAKATGFLPDGTKVSANGQLMLGDGSACVTLVSTNKKAPLGFNLWLQGGSAVVEGLGDIAAASKVGALGGGKSFTCSLLGAKVPVTVAGKQWSVATDKATALKLTFTPKTGVFKGSFKVGKQKASINGVVVNGVGYGSAVIKKGDKAAVTIE